MKRKTDSKQPPVQGVQIANMVSCIRINALDTTMIKEERLMAMEHNRNQALQMLEQYYQHWVTRTNQLGD